LWNLFEDLLAQVLDEPQQSEAWMSIHRLCTMPHAQSERAAVITRLQALQGKLDVRADVLRLTLLRDLSGGEAAYAAAAAQCALSLDSNADRMGALAAYAWGFAVKHASSASAFAEQLRAYRVPELVAGMTLQAAKELPSYFVPRVPQRVARVAVVLPYASNAGHTPSAMVAAQCAVLARCGMTIGVFGCQEQVPAQAHLYQGSSERVVLSPFDVVFWQNNLPNGVELHLMADSQISLRRRWRVILEELVKFDPDLVFEVGLYSPLAGALYGRRAVLALNVHGCEPMVPSDVWLSSSVEPVGRGSIWGEGLPTSIAHPHPYRLDRPKSTNALSRKELGIADDALVWITVGHRLGSEIGGEWAAQVLSLLQRSPNVVWLLVGSEAVIPAALDGVAEDRVRVLGFRSDVADLLNLSDICLNPPRMGGGFSVAEAMAAGRSVVSFRDGDGGDKLGPFAALSLDAYLNQLQELTVSSGSRQELGLALLARFKARLDLISSDASLCQAMALSIQHAAVRLHVE